MEKLEKPNVLILYGTRPAVRWPRLFEKIRR